MSIAPDSILVACPSRPLLSRIGEKWTLMVVVALADGPTRFGALRTRIEGISQKLLTQSLRGLERDGLVARQIFDDMPLRVEYRLTELGRGLLPLAVALKRWAEASLPDVVRHNRAHDSGQRG